MSWNYKIEVIADSIFVDGIEVDDSELSVDDWESLCQDGCWPCVSCDVSSPVYCEPHEFDSTNHYCGGSPACCP